MLDAMLPYLVNYYGNPHSRTHAYGWESEAAMEHSRQVSTKKLSRYHCQEFSGLWEAFPNLDRCGWSWKWFGALLEIQRGGLGDPLKAFN